MGLRERGFFDSIDELEERAYEEHGISLGIQWMWHLGSGRDGLPGCGLYVCDGSCISRAKAYYDKRNNLPRKTVYAVFD